MKQQQTLLSKGEDKNHKTFYITFAYVGDFIVLDSKTPEHPKDKFIKKHIYNNGKGYLFRQRKMYHVSSHTGCPKEETFKFDNKKEAEAKYKEFVESYLKKGWEDCTPSFNK